MTASSVGFLVAPTTLKAPLSFCAYNGSSCCNSTDDDAALRTQFQSMNISDAACAAVMKSILCAQCDPFSAELFGTEPRKRTIPYLCNSTGSASSSLHNNCSKDFCKEVWDTCKDISTKNSPFAGLPVSSSKLTDIWQSATDFCKAFGGSSGDNTLCFNGDSVPFNSIADSPTPKGLCLERLGNGSYLNMVAHPDGSNRVFLSNQAGKIWLATIPEHGSGGTLELDESNPFLDLTDEVHFDTELGLMGLAFHPNFTTNGRFFVSYNCDKLQSATCSGRCSCNSDIGCDPSKLGTDNGAQPCQYQTVVAEFTANDSSTTPSTVYIFISSSIK
ncbi:hypothetical protein B296_00043879 [Ensete ventricosum]|uniref:Glucose/Sorbosone dehydrogenase domain-containing protein n=1 Tax=Ensete ventricosum TaxID=4639 RepID=A0A426YMB1_ENSVE|nr:hypothetical protein B296_00043879 [Ensete ventricosum]